MTAGGNPPENPPENPLYKQVILEHARHPRNSGRLEPHTHRAGAVNPLCGDELEVTLLARKNNDADGGAIGGIKALVRGCAISQAAASLMTEAVLGLPLQRAAGLGGAFREALENADAPALPAELEALQPLIEVRKHRSRIRCALLAWEALEEIANDIGGAAPKPPQGSKPP